MANSEEILKQVKIIVGISGIIVTVISAVITIVAIHQTMKTK